MIKVSTIKCMLRLWLGSVVLVLCNTAIAQNSATVTVKVTVVIPPPCVINGNNPIEVNFGYVDSTKVNGVNYRIPLDYILSCEALEKNAMQLQIQGASSEFDETALMSSIPELGIRLQSGDSMLPLNTWLKFIYPNKPALYVVPVKKIDATLPGGEFTAAATLKLAYQ